MVQLTPNELVGEVESLNKTGAGGDGEHRLMVGDWIAEWDFTYGAWFYYNTKTGGLFIVQLNTTFHLASEFPEKSTWEQPPEMAHIKFKDPKTAEGNTVIQGRREISALDTSI